MNKTPLLIAVMGPTASGKSALAEQIAEELDAQLINADAFQVYRGMDIGTAKPIEKDRYALLDLKNPDEQFGVGEFCLLASQLLEDLFHAQKSAVVVGGTGFYIRALFDEYKNLRPEPKGELRDELNRREMDEGIDSLVAELLSKDPSAAETVDLLNPVRVKRALERCEDTGNEIHFSLPPFHKIKIGIQPETDALWERIEMRTRLMVQNDWVNEVIKLLDDGYELHHPGMRAIGYREISDYLKGKTELEEAITTTIVETRRYAKRQRTWLRSEPGLTTIGEAFDDLRAEALSIVRGAMQ